MEAILTVALPVLGLILAGYGARRLQVLDVASVRGVNAFVFHFALPALLFSKVALAPLARLLDPSMLGAYYGASALLALGTAVIARLAFGGDPARDGLRALAAMFSNTGYMGVAIVVTAFGADAATPVVLILTVDGAILMPLVIVLLEARTGAGSPGRAVLRAVTRNPLILAVAAGLAIAALRLPLPAPLLAFADLLGAAAAPCALFAIGATLAAVPLSASGEALLLAGAKILAHPLLVLLATRLVGPAPEIAALAILIAAMPTAANVYVLAERYEVDPEVASAAVFLSHLGSVLTVSLLLAAIAG